MKCLQGHFLVAAPGQLDPNFAETVILVVEHTDRGALGVVINRLGDHADRIFCRSNGRTASPGGERLLRRRPGHRSAHGGPYG